jgi:Tfp pilus assembly protein PilN
MEQGITRVPIQVDMNDVKEVLAQKEMVLLQMRASIRTLSQQVTLLTRENEQMRKDLEEMGRVKEADLPQS